MRFGEVDCFSEGLASELIENNVYEFAECHQHYHFQHYGVFYFDAPGAEPGGEIAFYVAPASAPDAARAITCSVQ